MKRILKNWQFKLLALGISFVIWLVIVNVSDPVDTATISGINIQFANEQVITDGGKAYSVSGTPKASIRVTGRRSVLSALTADDFQATADFKDMYRDDQVPVTVTCTSGEVTENDFTQVTDNVAVTLEDLQTSSFNIEVVTEGSPAEGYSVGGKSAQPAAVEVTGPASIVSRIRSAAVNIDVTGASAAVTGEGRIILRDAYGEDMLESENINTDTLTLSAQNAEVTVEVMHLQSVQLTVEADGADSVASGYIYTGYTVTPERVAVAGRQSVLDGFDTLKISSDLLSLEGATGNVTALVDISDYLPGGVYLVDSENSSVSVTMKVEPIAEKSFELAESSMVYDGIAGGLTAALRDLTLTVTLSGPSSVINSLNSSAIKATVDMSAYSAAGTYVVPVTLQLPAGVSATGDIEAAVILS